MGRHKTVSVKVEVDVDDVLYNLSDDDLIEELKSRSRSLKMETKDRDHLLHVYHHLNLGEYSDATIALHALLFPKFKSLADCLSQWKAQTKRTTP